ncbi:hypothetical protein [Stagnihabitans tardus]|uniref:PH domain-containing protein n=1 Tax=Stagnihabitans tardus TaxID=2699202 RepID=A0AAE5BW62_9RHOB|nr:hypothetical protein [Stagnihabitans tardus]NBZ88474.1 hypothetical protein [Stagnihabitans tardus]
MEGPLSDPVIHASFRSSWFWLMVRVGVIVYVEHWVWNEVYGPPRAHAGIVHPGPLLLAAWLGVGIVAVVVPLFFYKAFINSVQLEVRSDGLRFAVRGLIPWADIGKVEILPAKGGAFLWRRWQIAIEAKARPIPSAAEAGLWSRLVAYWRTSGNSSRAILDQGVFARPLKEIAASIEAHRPQAEP